MLRAQVLYTMLYTRAMARPTAAAGLVGAVLVMVLALSTGQRAGIWNRLPSLFPGSSLPPPVRISCKENTTVNVAVHDNSVVLATSDSQDIRQLWYQVYTPNSVFADNESSRAFLLVNVATEQAMVPSNHGSRSVQLTSNNNITDNSHLWGTATPAADGFYQVIKVYEDQALNGLWGNVHDGTVIGTYPSNPVTANTLWNITNVSSCCFP